MFKKLKDMDDTKKLKYFAYIRGLLKIAAESVIIISCVTVLRFIAPYVEGTEVMENPFTNSQLTAMLFMGVIVVGMMAATRTISKMGRK